MKTRRAPLGLQLLILLTLIPLASAKGEGLYPQPVLVFSHEGAADMDDPTGSGAESVSVENSEIAGRLALPPATVRDTRIGTRILARRNVLSFDDEDDTRVKLYEVAVPVTFDYAYTDDWSARGILSPALASDFESLGVKSIRGSLAGMIIHQLPNDGPTLAGGVIFLPALGDNRFIPTANAVWSPSPQMTISAGLTYVPDSGQDRVAPSVSLALRPREDLEIMLAYPHSWVAYAVNPDVTLYANAAPYGGRWRVTEVPGIEDDGVIRLREFRTGAGAGWALGPVRLITEAGAVWNREYEIEPDDAPEITSDIDETWYVMLGLTLTSEAIASIRHHD